MSEWKKVKLGEISHYVNEKSSIASTNELYYVSTDSMLKDRGGVISPESIPANGNVTKYKKDDILVSNIRPYFKKIWFSNRQGGCSNDVLVFRAQKEIIPQYLYYVLSDDLFFEHMMAGANGTKMPRGNKNLIMNYSFGLPPLEIQHRIATILSRYDSLIENYQKQIKLLEEAAQRLYKEWFVELRFPGHENTKMVDGLPEGWERKKLVDVSKLKAGGDRPKVFSNEKTEELTVPVFSNGTVNEGLYGYTKIAEVNEPSVTVSARGSIGFTVMRRTPYVPIVRLISIIPINVYVGYLYFYIKGMPLDGNGAAQQQITVPMIKDKEILMPSHLILKVFEENVEPLFIMAETHKNQIRLLTEARDRLLPRLMGGGIIIN